MLFPVGSQLSPESFRTHTPETIAARPILDPSASDALIDWRDHIAIDIADANIQRIVSQTLDQIASVPQGRQLLRQAIANQQARHEQSGAPAMLRIADGARNEFSSTTGTLTFSLSQIVGQYYPTAQGRAPFDPLHAVAHELFHAADGMNTAHYKQLMHDQSARFAKAAGIDPADGFAMWMFRMGDMQAQYMENPAIAAANKFLGQHFAQVARSLYVPDRSMAAPPRDPSVAVPTR